MSQATYAMRSMNRAELDTAVEWAAQEGWNPGLHDADVFWNTDPKGFVALDIGGEMVGCGSVVSYDGLLGFMGFFIVRPDLRGKGLGTDLWYQRRDLLLSRLKPLAAIGMDGVFAMQSFYAKGGFAFSHRNLRMETVARKLDYSLDKISKISSSDLQTIYSFDKFHFGFDREKFLAGWLSLPESLSLQYIDGGRLRGYGVIRKCRSGWKVGPLFCQNLEVADQLFRALSEVAVGEPIFLDAPENNDDAMKLASNHGMKESFGCARMYYGAAPGLPWNQIFGITTFELG